MLCSDTITKYYFIHIRELEINYQIITLALVANIASHKSIWSHIHDDCETLIMQKIL